jgi:hypothetical protein
MHTNIRMRVSVDRLLFAEFEAKLYPGNFT